MIIRPERVADYAAIGRLHARAFGDRAHEATIVALLRQRRAFDPELALVAEIGGRVAGHALFSPYSMRLLDQTIAAVILAPLAVDPAEQRRGIGGQLIAEGHRIALAKGHSVSILLGHPSYYPRFGYQTHAFGTARVVVARDASYDSLALDLRGPTDADVPALQALWRHEEGAVDLALAPGPDLLDWLSPNPAVRASVYIYDGEVVGYTRTHNHEPATPRVLLARDGATARAMVATLLGRQGADTAASACTLP
ncbi:MAG TPA: N-acetyltransferase, partial [Ktedonobacterales bacterium]|nr:N-acetyltransferase [Ktedonobacterales bacterium]